MASRVEVSQTLAARGFVLPALVHPSAFVEASASIGDGAQILAHSYVGSDAVVGGAVIVNTGAVVSHDCVLADHVNLSPGCLLAGGITVGEATLLGMGVTTYLGITIGANVRAGNGAIITASVPDGRRFAAGSVWTASRTHSTLTSAPNRSRLAWQSHPKANRHRSAGRVAERDRLGRTPQSASSQHPPLRTAQPSSSSSLHHSHTFPAMSRARTGSPQLDTRRLGVVVPMLDSTELHRPGSSCRPRRSSSEGPGPPRATLERLGAESATTLPRHPLTEADGVGTSRRPFCVAGPSPGRREPAHARCVRHEVAGPAQSPRPAHRDRARRRGDEGCWSATSRRSTGHR